MWRKFLVLIPHRRFEVHCQQTPAQVTAMLEAVTDPRPDYGWISTPQKPFIGRVSADDFTIVPSFRNRNSFRPILNGALTPAGDGTRITVAMGINEFIAGSMAIFVVGLPVAGMGILAAWLVAEAAHWPAAPAWRQALTLVLGIFVFAAAMMNLGFWWEATRAERMLRHIISEMFNENS